MASRGQKRLPDNVHLLRGTFKPSRHGKRGKAPLLTPELPSAPDWLVDEARTEWDRLIAVMGPTRVLTQADRMMLAQLCQVWSEFAASPAGFPVSRHAELRKLASELGLTPSSRAKLAVNNDDGQNNPFLET